MKIRATNDERRSLCSLPAVAVVAVAGPCYNARAVKRSSEPSTRLQQAGLLTAIPFVLLVGPALGYYLGTAIDHRWHVAPWGMTVGLILGLLSSARVTAQTIRQAQDLRDRDRTSSRRDD